MNFMHSKFLNNLVFVLGRQTDSHWAPQSATEETVILFGKSEDQEDGGLVLQRSILPELEFKIL